MMEADRFTMTRRGALLGVLLAPLVRPLKALGFERPDPWESEFTIKSGGYSWVIRTRSDASLHSVTFGGQPMTERVDLEAKTAWRSFCLHGSRLYSEIVFRMRDAHGIDIDWFVVGEELPPQTITKGLSDEYDRMNGDLTMMGGFSHLKHTEAAGEAGPRSLS